MDERFQLKPPDPLRVKAKFTHDPAEQQGVLFCGLSASPGQIDLFATDGPNAAEDVNGQRDHGEPIVPATEEGTVDSDAGEVSGHRFDCGVCSTTEAEGIEALKGA